jgi:multidrug efflux pump subunit AcrB
MIENINTHLEMAEHGGGAVDLKGAIIEASNQIVVPTFVSTTCICIVWLPLLQLGGVAGYLFLPLAEAVIFAMIASFILSRTLTPTMAAYLLRGQVAALQVGRASTKRPGIFTRFQHRFEARFERFREGYRGLLERLAAQRRLFASLYFLAALASLSLLVFVDFFPSIKSGEIALHARFQSGTRIEDSAKLGILVEQQVRDLLPGHVTNTLINCGLPISVHFDFLSSASGTLRLGTATARRTPRMR